MDCVEFEKLLATFFSEGKVSDEIKEEFEDHAYSCDGCWAKYESIQDALLARDIDTARKAEKVIQAQIDEILIKVSLEFYASSTARDFVFARKLSKKDYKIGIDSRTKVLVNGRHATFSEHKGFVTIKLNEMTVANDLLVEVFLEKKIVFKKEIPIRLLVTYKDQYVAEQKKSQPKDTKTDYYDLVIETKDYFVGMDNLGKIEIGIPLQ